MLTKLLNNLQGLRSYAIVLAKGDEVFPCLEAFVQAERIDAAQLSAIGAFQSATLGYFDWQSKDYVKIPVAEQTEVAALLGDVAMNAGKPGLHIHCVLSHRDGSAKAGHLLGAVVRPTLEIMLTETPAHLKKRYDPESGLALIDPSLPN